MQGSVFMRIITTDHIKILHGIGGCLIPGARAERHN